MTYAEMCKLVGVKPHALRRGMNFNLGVVLMNETENGRYEDQIKNGTISYEGHDRRRCKACPNNKDVDQTKAGENGRFFSGIRKRFRIFSKEAPNRWKDLGDRTLVNARMVYKFRFSA